VAEIEGAAGPGLAGYLARADEAMYQAKKLGKQRVLPWRAPA
jgi:PleD family two-component response regulator